MKSYEIVIDIGKILHYSDVLKPDIDNETLLLIINSFSLYVRDLYKVMIEESIFSQRYKGGWEPREEKGYAEYLGTTPSDHHIITLMYDALEIRESREDVIIRFDPRFKYPDSNLSLLRVLNAIDNGTSKFNARPILNPIVRQLNSSIPKLWVGYLKRKGVA